MQPFDVEPFRTAGRTLVVREVTRPLVVLGSTQPAGLVDEGAAARAGVRVARRRSGGGTVLLDPGGQLWVDAWIPRGDPLWDDDPRRVAAAVGDWWATALAGAGVRTATLSVHRGPSVPAPGSEVVCFAGTGPGEVLVGGRKIVGLAQWRSREGALVHACAYRRVDPLRVVPFLVMDADEEAALVATLSGSIASLAEVGAGSLDADALAATAPPGAPFAVARPPAA